MRTRMTDVWLSMVAMTLLTGCTHIQLRNNTIGQARTVADIHQQQVLDNLAKFAYDYNSLPHFSIASGGTSQVTDNGSLSYTAQWFPNLHTLNPSVSREALETWTMIPINDPRKLELMRCAFQKALTACVGEKKPTSCPSCERRFNEFYTGDAETAVQAGDPRITTNCLSEDACWLGIGCKNCVPKKCPCSYVGHYCDVYVWVLPDGQDQLTKLTMAILDFAVHDPPAPTKEVVCFLDAQGRPTTEDLAVSKITAQIGFDESPDSVCKPLPKVATGRHPLRVEGAEPSDATIPQYRQYRQPMSEYPASNQLLNLRQQLQTVTPRSTR